MHRGLLCENKSIVGVWEHTANVEGVKTSLLAEFRIFQTNGIEMPEKHAIFLVFGGSEQ